MLILAFAILRNVVIGKYNLHWFECHLLDTCWITKPKSFRVSSILKISTDFFKKTKNAKVLKYDKNARAPKTTKIGHV